MGLGVDLTDDFDDFDDFDEDDDDDDDFDDAFEEDFDDDFDEDEDEDEDDDDDDLDLDLDLGFEAPPVNGTTTIFLSDALSLPLPLLLLLPLEDLLLPVRASEMAVFVIFFFLGVNLRLVVCDSRCAALRAARCDATQSTSHYITHYAPLSMLLLGGATLSLNLIRGLPPSLSLSLPPASLSTSLSLATTSDSSSSASCSAFT